MTEPLSPQLEAKAKPPRFSWGMRLFLCFILFDMIFRSHMAVTPYLDWLEELGMNRFPKRLPTWQEVAKLREKAEPNQPDPAWKRVGETLADLPNYFNPWPQEKIRAKLEDAADWGKYSLCWLASRLDLFESLTGFDQRWTMFSPTAATRATLPRLRLLYQDGTTLDLRLLCDPSDLTDYGHWFEVKLLDCEVYLTNDSDGRLGYFNFVRHQYPHNQHGAALEKVYLYKFRYYFPKPDEDPDEILSAQNGPPAWDKHGPAWVYDPKTHDVFSLSEEQSLEAQKQLAAKISLGEITPSYTLNPTNP